MSSCDVPHIAEGVGIDVASVSRVATVLKRSPRFVEKVFTPSEVRDCAGRAERFAVRWAAKEAVRKVYSSSGIAPLPAMRSVEVIRSTRGVPSVTVDGSELSLSLSLSHEGDVATAVVVSHGGFPVSVPLQVRGRLPQSLCLPARPDDSHKWAFGTVVIVAGSPGFTGAAYLSATAAMRGGAGLVRLCVGEGIYSVLATKCTEVMVHPLLGSEMLDESASAFIRSHHLHAATALVVGPGLGTSATTADALCALITNAPCPVVADADALTIAAQREFDWSRVGQPAVITPHVREMGRLVGQPDDIVQGNRVDIAKKYAAERGVTVVLKGSQTVVAAPDGRHHVDEHRVVALASGGTGDVLTGLIGALCAQGSPPYDAAVAGVFIHGDAGALLQDQKGRAGVVAGDVLDMLPVAQERLRRWLEMP